MSRAAIFLLPIYDEAALLEVLLGRIRDARLPSPWRARVLAVDDGSGDGSAAILARPRAELDVVVLTHERNLGLAQTLYDGLAWIARQARDDDAVILMDADDTHDPADAAGMLSEIDRGHDLVLASRFHAGASTTGVAAHRRAYGGIANALLRATLAVPAVTDYGCGFRAVRAAVVRRAVSALGERLLELRPWGFICTAELLWKLSLFEPRIAEVPLHLRYDRKQSASKMPSLRTMAGYAVLAGKGLGWRASRRRVGGERR